MSRKLNELVVDGKHLSPVLDEDVKNYLIDIDGTICDDVPNEEPERMATVEPYPDALEVLNNWYEGGQTKQNTTMYTKKEIRNNLFTVSKTPS